MARRSRATAGAEPTPDDEDLRGGVQAEPASRGSQQQVVVLLRHEPAHREDPRHLGAQAQLGGQRRAELLPVLARARQLGAATGESRAREAPTSTERASTSALGASVTSLDLATIRAPAPMATRPVGPT
jgi:hypothetical protein